MVLPNLSKNAFLDRFKKEFLELVDFEIQRDLSLMNFQTLVKIIHRIEFLI